MLMMGKPSVSLQSEPEATGGAGDDQEIMKASVSM
jgi:hypothetical protein